jgi:hypothetical protein
MPRIPMKVIEHKLGIDQSDRCEAIRQEFNRLIEVEFIRPVDYPSWQTNLVLVENPDGSWRICIDYTSLNKACPKDEYPLP